MKGDLGCELVQFGSGADGPKHAFAMINVDIAIFGVLQ